MKLSPNECENLSGETEVLLGGLCDGLRCRKTDSPIMYGGMIGNRKIEVYLRSGADGRLHYSHTVRLLPALFVTSGSAPMATIECKYVEAAP